MNKQLQAFARANLKENLALLPTEWQRKFKLMYGMSHEQRSVSAAEAMSVSDIVDAMPAEKLDWAMQQVESSVRKALP